MFNGDGGAVSTESQLTRSVRNLDEQITQLEKFTDILIQRLKPIRNEKPLAEAKELQAPRAPKSPLTDGIDVFACRIVTLKKYLDCLLQEIEL